MPVEQPDRKCRVALLRQLLVGHELGAAGHDEPSGRGSRGATDRLFQHDQGRGRTHWVTGCHAGGIRLSDTEARPAANDGGPCHHGLGQLASWRTRRGRHTAGVGQRQIQVVEDRGGRLEEQHVTATADHRGEGVERGWADTFGIPHHDRGVAGSRRGRDRIVAHRDINAMRPQDFG